MNQIVSSSLSVGIGQDAKFSWLASLPAENVWLANFTSPHTRRNYQAAVLDFVGTLGIDSSDGLYSVQQSHVIAYREALRQRGVASATIESRLAALSSLFACLADKQLMPTNPAAGVKRPKSSSSGLGSGKTPALTAAQVREMLEAPDPATLKGLRDRAILHVLFYTGARIAEPTTLRVRDYRMDADYWVLEFKVKGEKTNVVAIHAECQIAIRRYLDQAGHGNDLNAPLFQATKQGNNLGGPLRPAYLAQTFKAYALQVGLPLTVVPHSARATFITRAYEASIPGEDIQRTVGHASITTTEGYNRTTRRHKKSASLAIHSF